MTHRLPPILPHHWLNGRGMLQVSQHPVRPTLVQLMTPHVTPEVKTAAVPVGPAPRVIPPTGQTRLWVAIIVCTAACVCACAAALAVSLRARDDSLPSPGTQVVDLSGLNARFDSIDSTLSLYGISANRQAPFTPGNIRVPDGNIIAQSITGDSVSVSGLVTGGAFSTTSLAVGNVMSVSPTGVTVRGHVATDSLAVTGSFSISSIVADVATIREQLTTAALLTADLAVSGTAVASNVVVSGLLSAVTLSGSSIAVGGAADVGGSLHVAGNTTVDGLLLAASLSSSSIVVGSAADVGGDLHVAGNTTVDGLLSAASLSSSSITADNLHVTGNATVDGQLLAGPATIVSATVANDMSVGGLVSAASMSSSGALSAQSVFGGTISSSGVVMALSMSTSGALSAQTVSAVGVLFASAVSTSGTVTATSVSASGTVSVNGVIKLGQSGMSFLVETLTAYGSAHFYHGVKIDRDLVMAQPGTTVRSYGLSLQGDQVDRRLSPMGDTVSLQAFGSDLYLLARPASLAIGTYTKVSTTTGSPSDQILKTNVRDIGSALETVLRLRGRRFEWADTAAEIGLPAGTTAIGFIAQELEQILPEVVRQPSPRPDGRAFRTVDYGAVVPLLVEAIRELSEKCNR